MAKHALIVASPGIDAHHPFWRQRPAATPVAGDLGNSPAHTLDLVRAGLTDRGFAVTALGGDAPVGVGEVLGALQDLPTGPVDELLVYFVGHGFEDRAHSGSHATASGWALWDGVLRQADLLAWARTLRGPTSVTLLHDTWIHACAMPGVDSEPLARDVGLWCLSVTHPSHPTAVGDGATALGQAFAEVLHEGAPTWEDAVRRMRLHPSGPRLRLHLAGTATASRRKPWLAASLGRSLGATA